MTALSLYEDLLAPGEVLELPAGGRIVYVASGELATLHAGSAAFGDDEAALAAGRDGATVLRWELTEWWVEDAKLSAPVALDPWADYVLRCERDAGPARRPGHRLCAARRARRRRRARAAVRCVRGACRALRSRLVRARRARARGRDERRRARLRARFTSDESSSSRASIGQGRAPGKHELVRSAARSSSRCRLRLGRRGRHRRAGHRDRDGDRHRDRDGDPAARGAGGRLLDHGCAPDPAGAGPAGRGGRGAPADLRRGDRVRLRDARADRARAGRGLHVQLRRRRLGGRALARARGGGHRATARCARSRRS